MSSNEEMDGRPVAIFHCHEFSNDVDRRCSHRWLQLMQECERRVCAYLRRATSDVDERADLLAETRCRAWADRFSVVEAVEPSDAILTHARAACRDWMRSRRRYYAAMDAHRHFGESLIDDLRLPDHADAAQSNGLMLKWRELSAHQRNAIWFHDILEMTLWEVADAIGCSVSTAKTHYYRGIQRLRMQVDVPRVKKAL